MEWIIASSTTNRRLKNKANKAFHLEGFLFRKTLITYIYKKMAKVLLLITFIIANIILAKIDTCKISENKKIYHGINALVYFALLYYAYLDVRSIQVIFGLALVRIPVFNTSLNYFRGLQLTYISSTTTSIIDRLTNPIVEKIGYWRYHIVVFLTSIALILI